MVSSSGSAATPTMVVALETELGLVFEVAVEFEFGAPSALMGGVPGAPTEAPGLGEEEAKGTCVHRRETVSRM